MTASSGCWSSGSASCRAPSRLAGRDIRAFHHRHALLSQSGLFKERSLPRREKSGSGARGRASQLFIRGAASAPRRRFLFLPVPLRPDTLCLAALASRLCARPARTARSGGRGTLGRDLSGPAATLAARRKRRLLPTDHRHDRCSRRRSKRSIAQMESALISLRQLFLRSNAINGLAAGRANFIHATR